MELFTTWFNIGAILYLYCVPVKLAQSLLVTNRNKDLKMLLSSLKVGALESHHHCSYIVRVLCFTVPMLS